VSGAIAACVFGGHDGRRGYLYLRIPGKVTACSGAW